jgi:hypothetical protein
VARKTFNVFYPSIGDHIFDVAFVIEADKDEELPEHVTLTRAVSHQFRIDLSNGLD